MTSGTSPRTGTQGRVDLLDPAEVGSLGALEFTTNAIVDGFLAGLHRSSRRGYSVEFAEHRPYEIGDDPRHIDWKLLARTDRLQVRRFEEETNLRSMLVLDASASMGWRGSDGRLTKLEYATRLAAALALVLVRQRDAVGLLTFDSEVRDLIPPRLRRGHWRLLANQLSSLQAGSSTAAEPALRQVVGALRRRGLVVFISDLLLDRELTFKALRFLKHRGHDVLVLHIADPSELDLENGEETRFRDPETGRAVTLAPTEWRSAYRETVAGAIRAWGTACRGAGMNYSLVTTDQPFGVALGRALAQR